MEFQLKSDFLPAGDQPQAISKLTNGLKKGLQTQVLLGITGSGKTFTVASVINNLKVPTLVISHNKTLAAQLYQEFKALFPSNAVCYFVSYYDYYQPEAYLPQTDTYIEKETEINQEIDKLRLSTTANILTRHDVIVIASVSCIYNLGSPTTYESSVLELSSKMNISRELVLKRLIDLSYKRNDFEFTRGTFRVRGETVDIFLAYQDRVIRVNFDKRGLQIAVLDPLNMKIIKKLDDLSLYPAKHYLAPLDNQEKIFAKIRFELDERIKQLLKMGKKLEAYRLNQKVNYDLEMIAETGYVNGIENYSRYFDGRSCGDPPFTLLDYFKQAYQDNWLLIIDESHMTIPQLRAMYQGDRSRKLTLIDFGFRLPSALDNRPLKFAEFFFRVPQTIYVSATPDEWEVSRALEDARKFKTLGIIEQLIRPTGIVDPKITIRKTVGQINDLIKEIKKRKHLGQRVLITTLTKRMAEDLASHIQKVAPEILVSYLHSDIETLERTDILENLRRGKYDVLVGINLLREGLDLPEVSLVAILDADKEGFLRSKTSLIQTMGRAARHVDSEIIMYADTLTASMIKAIKEIDRRRKIQIDYNLKNNIRPVQITKPIRERIVDKDDKISSDPTASLYGKRDSQYTDLLQIDINQLTPYDQQKMIKKLEIEMKKAAATFNFELAAEIRDIILKIKKLDTKH